MLRKSVLRYFQYGVHTGKNVKYNVAKMKHWPSQNIPENFNFTSEQRFKTKALPRDVGKIPRNFVLSILYQHQPCEVSSLWSYCISDSRIVLDSKRHLREVLQQARAEGFICFEQDAITQRWVCHLTRERFEEVRTIALHELSNKSVNDQMENHDDKSVTSSHDRFYEMSEEAKDKHEQKLQEEVSTTTEKLRRFQHTEIDYLPYTDLNGKVNFMWWYETADVHEPITQVHDQLPSSGNAHREIAQERDLLNL